MARPRRRGHSALPPARATALKALSACLKGADIQAALDQAIVAAKGIQPRDAALATELAYGTLRLKLRLDWLLSRYLKDPDALPLPMRLALTVAAYEITRLDKIPVYASVDWCVEYVKGINPKLAKVANAVLRRLSHLGQAANAPDTYKQDDPEEAEFLSRFYATPQWIVRLWLDAYGDDARAYLAATIEAPAIGLRIRPNIQDGVRQSLGKLDNVVGTDRSGIAFSKAPEGLPLLLEQGEVLRQSFAGQQAMHALGMNRWQGPVWDCCSGRGGKSMLMADHGVGPILASDPSKARLKGLAREIKRLGITTILPVRCRADLSAPLPGPVPTILVDAPCSGLGVMARRPDSKLKRSPHDLDGLVAIQARILDNVANHLVPGGTLAYVTCTLNPDENENQVRRFLDRNPRFSLANEHQTPPDSVLGEYFYAAKLVA